MRTLVTSSFKKFLYRRNSTKILAIFLGWFDSCQAIDGLYPVALFTFSRSELGSHITHDSPVNFYCYLSRHVFSSRIKRNVSCVNSAYANLELLWLKVNAVDTRF